MRCSELVTSFGIFIASASLFIILRTQQYLAVDGAIRCLSVYWQGRPAAGGNNHLLYFVDVFVWTKALFARGCARDKRLRFRAVDPLDERACSGWIGLGVVDTFLPSD